MSINQSPPEWAHSPNISILKRVTSRVSQWFSPNANPSANSPDNRPSTQDADVVEDATSSEYNGSHRRLISDVNSPEDVNSQPPLKRSKTTVIEEHHTVRRSSKSTLTSSTPTTSQLNSRRRLRGGFAGNSGGVTSNPFDFSSLGTTSSAIGTSFNPDMVRLYKGQEHVAARQVVLGYSGENEGNYVDQECDAEDDDEDVDPDDEIQIVIKPAKSYLNCIADEDGDILTELKTHHHLQQQLGGKRNGGVDKEVGAESGSESAGSQDSNSVAVNLISKRRKLGLSRLTRAAVSKNGSSASIGSSLNFTSHLQSEKSLFSDKNMLTSAGPSSLNASTTSLNSLAPKRAFNAGLYGSMSALSDSRLLNIKSPYYNGPTMFGEASAYSQKPLYAGLKWSGVGANKLSRSNTGLPMLRPSSSLSSLSAIGSGCSTASQGLERSVTGPGKTSPNAARDSPKGTARRVLDLIDQLNSPLEEIRKMASGSLLNESTNAKRLPSLVGQRSRFSTDRHFGGGSVGVRLNSPKTPYSRMGAGAQEPHQEKQRSPMTTELQVPSMPQLLQMNKLQRSTEEIRRLAFRSRTGLNLETDYKLPPGEAASDGGSKMKVKLNRMIARGGSSTTGAACEKEVSGVMAVPKLSEIQFPAMTEMPKIDIKLPGVSSTSNNKIGTLKNTSSAKVGMDTSCKSRTLIFNANPKLPANVVITNDSPPAACDPMSASPAVTSEFRFAAPIALEKDAAVTMSPMKVNFTFSEPIPAEDSQSPPSFPAVFGSFKFNPGTAKVKEGYSVATPGLATAEPPKELKKGSVEEALGLNPKAKANDGFPATTSATFGDMFKPPSDSWSCVVCMVRNKTADAKCLACETPKPAKVPSPSAATALKPKNEGFAALIAAQKVDKWECGDCMLKNEQSALKCICCESPKPGSVSVERKPESTQLKSSNPFAPAAGGAFAFGYKATPAPVCESKTDEGFAQLLSSQQTKWECSTCMTRNEQTKSKCACCEQTKPGSETEKAPQFSFGAVSNNNKFSFGMPKSEDKKQADAADQPLSGTFTFGASGGSKMVAPSASPALKCGFGVASTAETSGPNVQGKTECDKADVGKPATAPAIPMPSGLKFGTTSQPEIANSSKLEATVFGAEKITPSGGFKFGMSTTAPKTASAVTAAVPGGFSFGASSAKVDDTKSDILAAAQVPEEKGFTPTVSCNGSNTSTAPCDRLFGSTLDKDDVPQKVAFDSATSTAKTPLPGADKEVKELSKGLVFGSALSSAPAPTEPSFAFGAASAPTTSSDSSKTTPLFSAIKPIAFGTTSPATSGNIDAPKPAFAFGGGAATLKPAEESKVFGSSATSAFAFGQTPAVPSAAPSSPFGMASTGGAKPATPLFGGVSSATPSFGSSSAAVSTFGSSPFGVAASKAPDESSSVFGSAISNSPFGSGTAQTTGLFGGVPANQSFGRSAVVGSSFDVKGGPAPVASPFQFGGASGGETSNNQNRSFVFGAEAAQQTQPSTVDTRQAFNFSAGTAPNFNFGGGQETQQQQVGHNQPFAFGATTPQAVLAAPASQGMFNFSAGSHVESGGSAVQQRSSAAGTTYPKSETNTAAIRQQQDRLAALARYRRGGAVRQSGYDRSKFVKINNSRNNGNDTSFGVSGNPFQPGRTAGPPPAAANKFKYVAPGLQRGQDPQ